MKLRTEMLELGGRWRAAAFEDTRDPVPAREHDAMAAHALLQAMEIVLTDPAYCALSRKAAEILAGWMGEE